VKLAHLVELVHDAPVEPYPDAQRLLADYRSKRTQAPALIDKLLLLLDGPQQREAKELADKVLTVATFQQVVK
jgi:hypothetical protein